MQRGTLWRHSAGMCISLRIPWDQAVQDGLLTPEEATDFVLGRLL